MATTNRTNINISTINVFNDINNIQGNVSINNSIKIPRSALNTVSTTDNANAGILMKDINSNNSGNFYRLNVNSLPYSTPVLYFNGNPVIDSSNLLSELETILQFYPLETSNLIVTGGYINFFNGSTPNTNQGSNGVGLRYSSNNTVQFKNYNTDWVDLADVSSYNEFRELTDVDVYTNPLQNNQYITYNSTSNLFVNSNLAIFDDKNPTLAGNLIAGNHSIVFSNTTSNIIYNDNVRNNRIITFTNNSQTTNFANYLDINNGGTGETITDPILKCMGNDADVGLDITTKGAGDIRLNASTSNIYTNSDSIIVGGYVRNSIYRTSSKVGGYLPNTSWNLPIVSDTILFDFYNSNIAGTYWANVSAGIDGQKLNLIYNNLGSNAITILANFGSNGVIVGTGFSNGLVFNTSGQSTSMVYLGYGINAWQVLNTGAIVF